MGYGPGIVNIEDLHLIYSCGCHGYGIIICINIDSIVTTCDTCLFASYMYRFVISDQLSNQSPLPVAMHVTMVTEYVTMDTEYVPMVTEYVAMVTV